MQHATGSPHHGLPRGLELGEDPGLSKWRYKDEPAFGTRSFSTAYLSLSRTLPPLGVFFISILLSHNMKSFATAVLVAASVAFVNAHGTVSGVFNLSPDLLAID